MTFRVTDHGTTEVLCNGCGKLLDELPAIVEGCGYTCCAACSGKVPPANERAVIISSIVGSMMLEHGNQCGEVWDWDTVGQTFVEFQNHDVIVHLGIERAPTYEEFLAALFVLGIQVPGVICKATCIPDLCVHFKV